MYFVFFISFATERIVVVVVVVVYTCNFFLYMDDLLNGGVRTIKKIIFGWREREGRRRKSDVRTALAIAQFYDIHPMGERESGSYSGTRQRNR